MDNISTIRLDNISKQYGKHFGVRDIDLAIGQGECLALVGHNGAGKTTLIKLVLGFIQPTNGQLSIMGNSPQHANFNRLRKDIGFLPEQVLFQTNMTGREILIFYSRLKNANKAEIEALFERVDLCDAADDKISTYSKGMRQRLGLAQALIGQPKILILDEPTSGLDPLSRQTVYSIIDEVKNAGATVFISSHALTELDDRIDRVAILNQGQLVALGNVDELRENIGLKSIVKISVNQADAGKLIEHFPVFFDGHNEAQNTISLACKGKDKAHLLADILMLGIQLHNIEIYDPSLEQVFMKYTQPNEATQETAVLHG
ncbi:MAG: ABC transporter ATP-binding protein [Alphaproteobacteria bacterium]|nr:ABC transporter ATP-binding protein [Alphaproteobacteria bacterium]